MNSSFQDHWVDIDPERLKRYQTMFQWNPDTAHFYEGASIGKGQVVADFGCGPGHAAVVFAGWVGPQGHVHAIDINADFVRMVPENASARGVGERVTAHLMTDEKLPLDDRCLDRVIARNVIIYVDDPSATLGEFRRVLRPGGLAHMIEGDWRLTAVSPVPTADWRAMIEAASWVWPHPEIGRNLFRYARHAGFGEIEVRVLTSPDTSGRLRPMIETVAGYARESGNMSAKDVDAILEAVEQGLQDGTYLAISPQFVVTASDPA